MLFVWAKQSATRCTEICLDCHCVRCDLMGFHPNRQDSLDNCSGSFSTFVEVVFVALPDNLQCDGEPRCLQTTRRIFSALSQELFQLQSLAMEVPLPFVSCDFRCQLQFWSHHLPRSATHKPSQFVNSQASLSVCLVQLLSRPTPFRVIHKTAPVQS